MQPLPVFPEELKELEALIRSTIKPYIHLTLLPATEPLSVFTSKVGGDPFWLADEPYPTDSRGYPMPLLAQINFEEMPPLEDFPTEGILQFYISVMNGSYGKNDFEEPYYGKPKNLFEQKNYRIKYWQKNDLSLPVIQDFSFVNALLSEETNPSYDQIFSPIQPPNQCYRLVAQLSQQPVTYSPDFALAQQIDELVPADIDEIMPEFRDCFYANPSHKIGGYPVFTQYDERGYYYAEDLILLFELASDYDGEHYNIQWSDDGVANFFIHPDDLKNRNFNRVFYTWDCG